MSTTPTAQLEEDVTVLLDSGLFVLHEQWSKGLITPREYVEKATDFVQDALNGLPDGGGKLATVSTALAEPLLHELSFNVMGWQVRDIKSPFSTCITSSSAAVIATEIEKARGA